MIIFIQTITSCKTLFDGIVLYDKKNNPYLALSRSDLVWFLVWFDAELVIENIVDDAAGIGVITVAAAKVLLAAAAEPRVPVADLTCTVTGNGPDGPEVRTVL